MANEIIVSGFGGQGVLAIGKMIAQAGLQEGKEISWLPSYGAEMRGGTANCSVVVSEEPIISPLVLEPTELIVMNKPSLLKFEQSVIPGGTIFVNSSIVEIPVSRTDVDIVNLPCLDMAIELGNAKVANMVMLGAYVEKTGLVKLETIKTLVAHMFEGKKPEVLTMNVKALEAGAAFVRR